MKGHKSTICFYLKKPGSFTLAIMKLFTTFIRLRSRSGIAKIADVWKNLKKKLKIWFDYHCFLSFISYPLMIVLHLVSFDNNLFELDFWISKRNVLVRSNPLRKMDFLQGYDIFFQDSCSFSSIKTLLQDHWNDSKTCPAIQF